MYTFEKLIDYIPSKNIVNEKSKDFDQSYFKIINQIDGYDFLVIFLLMKYRKSL